MDGYLYRGEFTVSTLTIDGERYLTLLPDNRAVLLVGRSDKSVFRLYANDSGCILTTLPLTYDGREHCYPLDYFFEGDAGFAGFGISGTKYWRCRDLPFEQPIGAAGGSTNIIVQNCYLGCKAGRHPPFELFHLHPKDNPFFRPNKWDFRPHHTPPFVSTEKSYLNFSKDTFAIEMKDSILSNANFHGARLIGSNLTGSTLTSVAASEAVFGGPAAISSLDRTVWKKGVFSGTVFNRCTLKNANFEEGTFNLGEEFPFPFPMFKQAQFEGAILTDANFHNCDLRGINFKNADLRGADLSKAKMHKCILTNTWLAGADLSNTDLTTVEFAGQRPRMHQESQLPADKKTKFYKTKLNADLLGSDWTGVDLTGAEIQNLPTGIPNMVAKHSIFTGVDLTGRNLTDADFEFSTFDKTKFVSAKLIGANLANRDLRTAIFTNADLSGAKLHGADLSGCDLSTVTNTTPAKGSEDTKKRTKLCSATFKAGLFGKNWKALDMRDAKILNPVETDLTGLQADDAILMNVTLAGANFNAVGSGDQAVKASFKGTLFHASNLQGAKFKNAVLEGAQFGSYKPAFRMPYTEDQTDWRQALVNAGFEEAAGARLTELDPGREHLLLTGPASDEKTFLVRRELRAGGIEELVVLEPTMPANLSKAYFAGANLKNANLEGVTANGVHIYGGDEGASQLEGAMMARIRLTDANLGSVNLTKAQMCGANLQGANLVGAVLRNADLSPARNGTDLVATDLTGAYLADATFTDAKLQGAVLTDAAVATGDGVYLFSLNASAKTELDGAKGAALSKTKFKDYLAALNAGSLIPLKDELIRAGLTVDASATVSPFYKEPVEWEVVSGGATHRVELKTDSTKPALLVNGTATLDVSSLVSHLMALRTKRVDVLKAAFQAKGITLGDSTTIREKESRAASWKIKTSNSEFVIWTRLYDIGVLDLYVESAWDQLRQVFLTSGRPLEAKAKLKKENSRWMVDNDSDNPSAFAQGYVGFNIVPEGTGYAVFGITFRVSRLGASDRLEVVTYSLLPTKGLDGRIMDGETYCPNGSRLKELGPQGWTDACLRAKRPPKPPICVPTKYSWCPAD